ncbi:MAG: flagellar protein FlaG [Desulfovibrionaceae bacterium]|nr:flagellar protein FlaG [Desulfovibrionaceae bacterium]
MNIPEISTTAIKQSVRSESAAQAKAIGRLSVREDSSQTSIDVVNRQDSSSSDRQPATFSEKELNSMLSEMEEHFASNNVKLKFNVIEDNGTIQVEILDSEGNIIRKIPEDNIIKLSESLKNLGNGFLDKMS